MHVHFHWQIGQRFEIFGYLTKPGIQSAGRDAV